MVTQDNVSLIVISSVLYLVFYNLFYETWSRKCIKRIGSEVTNLVFIFGTNAEFLYILTCKNRALETEIAPQNLVNHKIAPWGRFRPR